MSDWTTQNLSIFKAVQMEKRVMFIILTLIVAVAFQSGWYPGDGDY